MDVASLGRWAGVAAVVITGAGAVSEVCGTTSENTCGVARSLYGWRRSDRGLSSAYTSYSPSW